MKVTHVMALFESKGHAPFSGAENHLFTLLVAQHKSGLDVEAIFIVFSNGPRIERKISELSAHGIEVRTVNIPWGRRPFRVFSLARSIGEMRRLFMVRKDRIIHTHLEYADIYAKIAALLAGCRVVTSFHNDEPIYKNKMFRMRANWGNRRTKHFIAISDRVREHVLRTLQLPAEKVRRIYYGVPPPEINQSREEIRSRFQIPASSFVVGFVGRFVPQKNIRLLLAALTHFPQIHAVLVGDGPLKAELAAFASELNLKNVQFLGYQENACDIMPAFDVFCLPSDWEGLGLVLVEAMQRSVPIIGSSAGAIPEILGSGKFGSIFESGNLDSLVQCIDHAVKDFGYFTQRASEAKIHADSYFAVKRMVDETSSVYSEVLKSEDC